MNFDGFISGSYRASSLLLNAMTTMNLFPEFDQSGKGKNIGMLVGTPGILQFGAALGAGPIRGMWGGGNRLFVVSGASLYEVFADGTNNNRGSVGNDGLPVTIVANGTQLAVMSAGQFYLDNGAGPVAVNYDSTATVSTVGTAVTWVSGDNFNSGMQGITMLINGVGYTVSAVVDDMHLTLGSSAGTQVSVPASWASLTGIVDNDGSNPTNVTWVSGDQFVPQMVGLTISIGGSNYTVISVTNSVQLVASGAVGIANNLPYHATIPVGASSLTFIDDYFVIAQGKTSKQFSLSSLPPLGGLFFDPLDVATKEGYPDYIGAVFADHEDLWIFGQEQSTEVWQDTGNANFPFQRIPGNFIHYGLGAQWSVSRLNNGIAWIAIDTARGGPMAMYAQGFTPVRISTHAVETAWASYSTFADAVAYSYIEQGHHFWVISFPSGNATWVYDATTSLWHERGWWNGASMDRDRVAFHAYTGLALHGGAGPSSPAHFVGDWQSGKIYLMGLQYLDHNGTAIHSIRACPHLNVEGFKNIYHRLQLDAEVVAGPLGGINMAPILDWSDDGGKTFGAQHVLPNGSTTDLGNAARMIWRRLGASRDRVFRITIVDKVKKALVGAYIELTKGTK